MNEVIHFILNGLKEFVIAALMLVAGLLFLPEGITLRILRRFRPDLVQRTPLMMRVREAFEIMLGKKTVVPDVNSTTFAQKRISLIQALVKEREILQGNLFFLDLLKNFSRMLYFAAGHDAEPPQRILTLLGESLNYLRNYSRELKDSTTFKSERSDVDLATGELDRIVMDAQKFLSNTAEGERELMIIRFTLKNGVESFDSYMGQRFNATNEALQSTSQRLANVLANHVENKD